MLELASRSYELLTGSEPVEKLELIQLVFQNLWMKDGKLEYVMHKPFDSIFKTGDSLAWGRSSLLYRIAFWSINIADLNIQNLGTNTARKELNNIEEKAKVVMNFKL